MHASVTDPEARLFKKSTASASVSGYLTNTLMENRNGLIVGITKTRAIGIAEREAALALIDELTAIKQITLGAERGYDAAAFVEDVCCRNCNSAHHPKHESSQCD